MEDIGRSFEKLSPRQSKSLWQRLMPALESPYGGHFTLSVQLMTPKYPMFNHLISYLGCWTTHYKSVLDWERTCLFLFWSNSSRRREVTWGGRIFLQINWSRRSPEGGDCKKIGWKKDCHQEVQFICILSTLVELYIHKKWISYTIAPRGGYYALSPHNITPESNFKVRKINKMITL